MNITTDRRKINMKDKVLTWTAIGSFIIMIITLMGYITRAAFIPTMANIRLNSIEELIKKREMRIDPIIDRHEKVINEIVVLFGENSRDHEQIKRYLERIEDRVNNNLKH